MMSHAPLLRAMHFPQVANVRSLRPALQATVVLLFALMRSMQIELIQPSMERGARDAQ